MIYKKNRTTRGLGDPNMCIKKNGIMYYLANS